MSSNNSTAKEWRVPAFFYGSFIRREIMALGGLYPEKIEVVKLTGYDIDICPHACIYRSDQHAICGILVYAKHQELDTLYLRDGVGVFLPEAVIVEDKAGRLMPATCYIPPLRGNKPPDIEYLENIIKAGREYGFPQWYIDRLERLK